MRTAGKPSWLQRNDDFGDFEQLLLTQRAPKHVFAVVSWGCAATTWVSRVLDSHPDILCLHAANTSLQRFAYPDSGRLDGLAYLRWIAGMADSYAAAGDVHGVSRHHVPAIREALGDHFRCAVLVRDPLPRIRSQMALFEQWRQFEPWDLDYVEGLAEAHALTLPALDGRARMFVHAANMLNAILEERDIGPIFRAKDVTSDPNALADLVTTLTSGGIALDRDWLHNAVRQPRVNRHKREGHSELGRWEIDVLRKVVRPEAWDVYAELGYERPSFLDPS